MINDACLVCGAELEYLLRQEKQVCQICGREMYSNARCKNGHFVCDECHRSRGVDAIISICLECSSQNPVEILEQMMDNPHVEPHGPEHHVIPGAALMTAYCNADGHGRIPLREVLQEIAVRGKVIPGGSCGFLGVCGAATSAGAFYSIITETTPMSRGGWGDCGKLMSKLTGSIAQAGGPRCCKRTAYTAVKGTVEYAAENLGVKMDMPEQIICKYSHRNNECIESECPFFAGKQK